MIGRVLTVPELIAAGVAPNAIDGLTITNQATVSGGCGIDQLTDDPDMVGFQPTIFELNYAAEFNTSSKSIIDINGGRLEPGDTVRFEIEIFNTRVSQI